MRHSRKIIIILNIKKTLPRIDAKLCDDRYSSKNIRVATRPIMPKNLLQAAPLLEPLIHGLLTGANSLLFFSILDRV